jgi:Mn2+/Fe2+ NRAMP family transporter
MRALGPGLITGASDDDPSGIATYSQAGAQFSYATAWTLLLTYPLMCAIQEISARIGRRHRSPALFGKRSRKSALASAAGIVALLFLANTINLGPISARWAML